MEPLISFEPVVDAAYLCRGVMEARAAGLTRCYICDLRPPLTGFSIIMVTRRRIGLLWVEDED